MQAAKAHQANLTKPLGSLGRLEQLAISFAGWQGNEKPDLQHILVRVFAGDHGVCAHGVSAFPQQVTAQMILNFIHGGAAISVLARAMDADFAVVNMGTVTAIADADNLINHQLSNGSEDFTKAPAMSNSILADALQAGREEVAQSKAQLFIGGDMGIGNTTSASAIISAILNLDPIDTVGPGTGIDEGGMSIKRSAVQQALDLHSNNLDDPLDVLGNLGGLEIAGLVGAYIASAQNGIPMLIDGFISTAAALLAVEINPSARAWMIFSHKSAEPAHVKVLQYLKARPLLDLDMRLGEGSGAAVAAPLLIAALDLHKQMATFADAGVSDAQ